jgi:hypothetical protein
MIVLFRNHKEQKNPIESNMINRSEKKKTPQMSDPWYTSKYFVNNLYSIYILFIYFGGTGV